MCVTVPQSCLLLPLGHGADFSMEPITPKAVFSSTVELSWQASESLKAEFVAFSQVYDTAYSREPYVQNISDSANYSYRKPCSN